MNIWKAEVYLDYVYMPIEIPYNIVYQGLWDIQKGKAVQCYRNKEFYYVATAAKNADNIHRIN